jgi:hypothetical protein
VTEQALALLRQFYPPEGMYLTELSNFSTSTSSIQGTFCVPVDAAYSIVPLGYVTAEQHVRCFSQLSYALMYLLCVYHDGMTLYMSRADFERLMLSGKMFYRRMDTRYRRQAIKGQPFQIQLEMTGAVKVEKFGVACLTARGPVETHAEFVVLL